ncbi:MAG: DUF1295 domain-containing protein [Sphingobacteriales bacterium]|nr:MAG: DUF1295 domain-containing protein [Sphingobacteriales bacterium]
MALFGFSALLVLAYMSLWFMLAVIKKDNGLADIAWGLGFVMLAWFSFYETETITIRQLMVNICITVWAVRLSGHIFQRNLAKTEEDFRYAAWRKEWGKNWLKRTYFQVFLLQGFFMLIIALPVLLAANQPVSGWETYNYIGLFVFVAGFLIESIADFQLAMFKSRSKNKGKLMKSGLWRYSRHPNYFGEALVWWGVFIMVLPLKYWFIALVSPVLMTYLLVGVSGIPMLERKLKNHPEFGEYAAKTSPFIPMPVRNVKTER